MRRSIRWEQNYFFENCLGRYFGVAEKEFSKLKELPALREIAETSGRSSACSGSSRFSIAKHHHSQRPGALDRFSGDASRVGGVRSRFSPFRSVRQLISPTEREELLAAYEAKRNAALSPVSEEFREIFYLCGIQRLMQALGAYGFLGLVKGNKTFLNHIPAAMTRCVRSLRD